MEVPKYISAKKTAGVLFFLPALVLLLIFLIAPMVVAVGFSFTKYTVLDPPRFIGFANYSRLFSQATFWASLRVTLVYVFVRVVIILFIALLLSLVLNQQFPFRGFFQTVSFLPFVFPLAVTSVVWKVIYRPFGLMENLTSLIGVGPLPWLSSGEYALAAVTISTIWSGVGYYAVIFLAGLQTIPKDILEAAVIDGAGNVQRFSKVILPLLKPTMFYVTVVAVIGTLQQFPPFMIMTGGGPGQATRVLGLFIYEYAFAHLNMGFACTASLVMFVLIMGFTLVQRRLQRYEVY